MILKCVGCGREDAEALVPEGLCYECSGDPEGVPDQNNGTELAESIVNGLAGRLGVTPQEAGQAYANADFMNKSDDREAEARAKRRVGAGTKN